MSRSVLIAAVCLGIVLLSRGVLAAMAVVEGTVSPGVAFAPLGLGVLIVFGMVKGHRLAWQWGRLLGLVTAALVFISAITVWAALEDTAGREAAFWAVFLGGQGAALMVMYFTLGTSGAREHFRLVCPQCGSRKVRAADFIYSKAKCRKCKNRWE